MLYNFFSQTFHFQYAIQKYIKCIKNKQKLQQHRVQYYLKQ